MAIDTQTKRRAVAAIPCFPSPILADGTIDLFDRFASGWSYSVAFVLIVETPEKYRPSSVDLAGSRYSRVDMATYRPGRAPDTAARRSSRPDREV